MLLVVANGAAITLLKNFLDEPVDPTGDVPVFETTIPLRITRADVQRYLYGNGDLAQIVFFGDDAIALPDPEQRLSPLDDRMTIDPD